MELQMVQKWSDSKMLLWILNRIAKKKGKNMARRKNCVRSNSKTRHKVLHLFKCKVRGNANEYRQIFDQVEARWLLPLFWPFPVGYCLKINSQSCCQFLADTLFEQCHRKQSEVSYWESLGPLQTQHLLISQREYKLIFPQLNIKAWRSITFWTDWEHRICSTVIQILRNMLCLKIWHAA